VPQTTLLADGSAKTWTTENSEHHRVVDGGHEMLSVTGVPCCTPQENEIQAGGHRSDDLISAVFANSRIMIADADEQAQATVASSRFHGAAPDAAWPFGLSSGIGETKSVLFI
jgi:hypothetical protein